MILHAFNEAGIRQFEAFLDALRAPEQVAVSARPHTEAHLIDPVARPRALPEGPFASRHDLAGQLMAAIEPDDAFLRSNRGVWAWLSCYYFESLCKKKDGRWRPGERALWIPEMGNWRRVYRHNVLGPLRVMHAHRLAPDRVRFMLSNPPNTPGELYEQFASRYEIITNTGFLSAASTLYLDPETGRPQRGAGGKDAGSPRRLAKDTYEQFVVTYDLYGMAGEKIMQILPHEYSRFRA